VKVDTWIVDGIIIWSKTRILLCQNESLNGKLRFSRVKRQMHYCCEDKERYKTHL